MPLLVPLGCVDEEVDSAAHVAAGAIGRKALHQVRGLVHLVVPCELAVIEIRRERHEARLSQTVRHLLDAGIQTPPLLDHQHAWSRAARGRRQVTGRHVSITAKFNSLSHARKDNLIAMKTLWSALATTVALSTIGVADVGQRDRQPVDRILTSTACASTT